MFEGIVLNFIVFFILFDDMATGEDAMTQALIFFFCFIPFITGVCMVCDWIYKRWVK